MQLIVTVKRLNKRRVIPVQFPDRDNIIGEVKEGFTFEGTEVTAVPNPALGKWYKDRDGHFYWGGGLSIGFASGEQTKNHYFDLLGITKIWNEMKPGNLGKNIKVAILDTGIDQNTAQLLNVREQQRFFCNEDESACLQEDGAADSDENTHGTRCASVIGARKLNNNHVGIAPDCEMFIYRIKDDFFFNKSKLQIPTALQHILDNQKDIDIISMSFQFRQPVAGMSEVLKKCSDRGILLFAASGNTSDLNEQFQINFPGFDDSCFEVGACDEQAEKIIPSSCYNEKLVFMAPGVDVPAFKEQQQLATENKTSIATAFTSGVAALLLSFARTKEPNKIASANKVIQALKSTGMNQDIVLPDGKTISVKIIQPLKAFINLKSSL